MTNVRKPAVAGMFYPGDHDELAAMVQGFLNDVPMSPDLPKAVIAPHAGYIYSGPVAASIYARIATARDRIKRVVLLGPSHRVAFQGVAASSADYFDTPLGKIRIDKQALHDLSGLPQVQILDEAHVQEHSLEVHLPFLLTVIDDFQLVPLVVGDVNYSEVAEVIEQLWGGDETLIVVSSDLSHYHDYRTAQMMDRQTSDAIEALDADAISYDQACGRVPVGGLLLAARQHGLRAHTLDLRNSGDTAGARDSVVGYGAYAFQ